MSSGWSTLTLLLSSFPHLSTRFVVVATGNSSGGGRGRGCGGHGPSGRDNGSNGGGSMFDGNNGNVNNIIPSCQVCGKCVHDTLRLLPPLRSLIPTDRKTVASTLCQLHIKLTQIGMPTQEQQITSRLILIVHEESASGRQM